jgi:hypothetical protein
VEGFAPHDLWLLRKDIREARSLYVETALELEVSRPLLCVARMVHNCWLTRELSFFRLRICPSAELSGLGAASSEGAELVPTLKRYVAQIGMSNSPIKREVQELSLAVQSQEVLLHGIMQQRQNRGSRPGHSMFPKLNTGRLRGVPEQSSRSNSQSPRNRSSSSSAGGEETCCAAAAAEEGESGRFVKGSITSVSSASTHSPSISPHHPPASGTFNLSAEDTLASARQQSVLSRDSNDGASTTSGSGISIHSTQNLDETPPPTVIGRASAEAFNSNVDLVASHLMEMIQAQQQLLAGLEQASTASSSNSPSASRRSNGTSRTGGSRRHHHGQHPPPSQEQYLQAALQNYVASLAASSSQLRSERSSTASDQSSRSRSQV